MGHAPDDFSLRGVTIDVGAYLRGWQSLAVDDEVRTTPMAARYSTSLGSGSAMSTSVPKSAYSTVVVRDGKGGPDPNNSS